MDFQSSCDMYQFHLKLFYLHSRHRLPSIHFQAALRHSRLQLLKKGCWYRMAGVSVESTNNFLQAVLYLELKLSAMYVLASDDFIFESNALTSCGIVRRESCSFLLMGTSRCGAFLEAFGRPRGRFLGSEWFIMVGGTRTGTYDRRQQPSTKRFLSNTVMSTAHRPTWDPRISRVALAKSP